ncbi:MAG: DNA-3-methyladenine glycosylase [Thaumarchaeota archaeon]|nr:DNA-3-methyladenine glycosylase [Nitrososphaerota archaeon]
MPAGSAAPLPRAFYSRDTVTVARDLLGRTLVRRAHGGRATMAGTIVETEAYRSSDDPASHARNGMTPRNRAMFGEVGRAYVYFTYGMHHCINAVARGPSRDAGAVLIRALAPTAGECIMAKNRRGCAARDVANGPAKLTQAMRITGELYGTDLTARGELYIAGIAPPRRRVARGPRVGIRRGLDLEWNFRLA